MAGQSSCVLVTLFHRKRCVYFPRRGAIRVIDLLKKLVTYYMIKPSTWVFALGIVWIIVMPGRVLLSAAWKQAQIGNQATAITQGKVIAYTPANHATGTVEYWVGGVRYEIKPWAMKESDVGTSVPVHYNPQHPSTAYSGASYPPFTADIFIVGFLLMFPIAVLLGASGFPRGWFQTTRTSPPPLPPRFPPPLQRLE
jgi:hypothetical protein